MPTTLNIDRHLAVLRASGDRLVDLAVGAGFGTPVPTCPGWSVKQLLAHQTKVHRWATTQVTGTDPAAVPGDTQILATVTDLPAYYREGLDLLWDALHKAPDDLEAMTFLKDAPPPRVFWARRQAHETTMHGIDALAAKLAMPPTTAETGIDADLAADGIDELLRGFFTRGKSKLYDGTDYVVDVLASDVGRRWRLRVSERLTVDPDGQLNELPGGATAADTTITGSAAGLYVALWNRGREVTVTGRPELLDHWRATQQIHWT